MKKYILLLLLLGSLKVMAQKSLNIEFRDFVYSSLDSLKTINKHKQSKIIGIYITSNLKGKLKEYKLVFKSKDLKLTRREYKRLFKILKCENYKKYETILIREEELKQLKELKYLLKYDGSVRF